MRYLEKHIRLIVACTMIFLSSSPTWATSNEDFLGTYVGTDNVTLFGSCAGGPFTGAYASTISGLNGNTVTLSGTSNATSDGSTVSFTGTDSISGNTLTGISGGLQDSAGNVGAFTSFSATLSGTTLTFNSTGDFGGGCTFSTNGSATLVSGDTVIVPEVTSSSTVTEAVLFNTQVQGTVSDVSSHISGALSGIGFTGGPRVSDNGFKIGGTTGLNAGDGSAIPYGVWGSYSYSDYENDLSSTAFDGSSHSFLGGIDFSFWGNTVVGVALGYDVGDIDTTFNRGQQDTDTYTIAPYFGALLSDNLSVDFALGYSKVDYDQFRLAPGGSTTQITSSPNADRWFGALNLNGITFYDNWIIGGRVGASFATSNIDRYTESNGIIVDDSRTKLGSVSIASDVAYSWDNYEPFINLSYQYDFQLKEITAATGPAISNDNDDILMTTGVRYFNKNGISGNIEYSKRFLREDFDEDRISLTIRADF